MIHARALGTSDLANVVIQGGTDEAYRIWKGKMIEAVYKPVTWPKKVTY